MDITAADLTKRIVSHKLLQTLNTARTIQSGTHLSLLNKSHTGRHTAKQGAIFAVHMDMP